MNSRLQTCFEAWIVDFAGFGFADCNPKIGARAPAVFSILPSSSEA